MTFLKMSGCKVVGFFLLLLISFTANGQRLRSNMYESLYSKSACYRRMNGTHQIGCSSKRGGSVGVVHVVSNLSDVDWLLTESKAGPYAVVLTPNQFTPSYINRLIKRPDVIAGILLVNNSTDVPDSFSHDYRCPNGGSQAPWDEMKCHEEAPDPEVWNPWGTGLMHRDYPFPMFYIPPSSDNIQHIYDCFHKFNSYDLDNQPLRSLCAVEMDSFMFAAVNSEVCIRKTNLVRTINYMRFCDPLAGKSIYTTLFTRASFTENQHDHYVDNGNEGPVTKDPVKEGPKSVALLTAALDGASLFNVHGESIDVVHGEGIDAVSTVSGLVTFIATAHLLHKMFPANESYNYDKNIVMMLLNGESYDLIGSQRLAWELTKGTFPPAPPALSPVSLGPHIHIGQLHGRPGDQINFFTPNYKEEDKNEMVDDLASWMSVPVEDIKPVVKRGRVPPSAVHSFLRTLNSSQTGLASAVVADHAESFTNKYYQSIMDRSDNLAYKYLNVSFDPSNVSAGIWAEFPDDLIPSDSVQSRLANISTALAHSLYHFVTGTNYTGSAKASPFIVDELLHCYLDTMLCRVVAGIDSRVNMSSTPIPPAPLYVGVSVWSPSGPQNTLLELILLTGTPVNRTKEECTYAWNDTIFYVWMSCWNGEGCCMRTMFNFTISISPAFEIPNYDFSSGQFSTWTESVWNRFSLRLLVVPPFKHEAVTLTVGVVVALLGLVIVPLVSRHAASIQPQGEQQQEEDQRQPASGDVRRSRNSAGRSRDATERSNETDTSHVDC